MRHLLTISELETDDLRGLIERSAAHAAGRADRAEPLADKVVGIYFRVTSTRTRSAFSAGALRLGARLISYGPDDLQLATGETIEDTTRVLSGYLDALVIRTNQSLEEMRELARHQETMAVVNALSEDQHPTQALADLSTLLEVFGRLEGLSVLYLGEGNSTAHSLAFSFAKLPRMRLTLVTPEGFGLPAHVLEEVGRLAASSGSEVAQHHDAGALPEGVDAVYTSRWQTMGVTKQDDAWRDRFRPYAVTPAVMERVSKAETVFLHDLPAVRGEDVMDEVLDGPRSKAWRQAEHKMFSAMAVLEWCLKIV